MSEVARPRLPQHLDAHLYCRKVDLLIPYFKNSSVGSYFVSLVGFPVAVAASFLLRQGNISGASEFLARALDCEHGILLKRFLGTWPWITRPESETLGSATVQAVMK